MSRRNSDEERLVDFQTMAMGAVTNALSCSLVTHSAEALYLKLTPQERERAYRRHPANTMTFQALLALEERAIVRLSEAAAETKAPVRRWKDLKGHRHSLSHTSTVKWKQPDMQDFADASRDVYDLRAALVWDLHRSLQEGLQKHGQECHPETLVATPEMAACLRQILAFSIRPEVPPPSEQALLKQLEQRVPQYIALLEKHPDGMRNLEREAKSVERTRERERRFAQLRAKSAEPTRK